MLFCFSTSLHCQVLFPCIFHVLAALRSIYPICFGTPAIPYEKSGFIMRPWQHLPNTALLKRCLHPLDIGTNGWVGRLLRKNATQNSQNSHSNTGPWSTQHWPHQSFEALGSCHPQKRMVFPCFSPLYKPQHLWSFKLIHQDHQGTRPPVQPSAPVETLRKMIPFFFTKPQMSWDTT